jgi:YbbR domain-containing protein
MADDLIQNIKDRILSYVKKGTKPGEEDDGSKLVTKEGVMVFVFAYLIAMSLWFAVNLNGNFNISVNMPLEIGDIPSDLALTDNLPEYVEVSLSGTALPLIGLYNNPPTIPIDVDDSEVNLFNQVRQQMNSYQEVEVSKVEPILVSVNLEQKITKKVPIKLNWDLEFETRFGLISEPVISPDSISVTGAISQMNAINEWVIDDTLKLSGVKDDIAQVIPISNSNPLLDISLDETSLMANVSEFTENEVSVYIRTRNLPRGQNITYNPSSIVIRYDVPLEQFSEIQNETPYVVYVPYRKIQEDETGFVTPDIELVATKYALKIRSFQPKAVAYFSVVDQ